MKSLFPLLLLPIMTAVQAGDFKTFATTYCNDCHDDATRKGKLSIESLSADVTSANAKDWLNILEQTERRLMPPADEEQPSAADRRSAILDLEGKLVAHAA